MQFLVVAYDGKGDDVYERRMAARQDHIDMISEYKAKGHMIIGAALLDDEGEKMIGSTLIVEFPDMDAVNEWLNNDPYVVNDVWEEVMVTQCQVAPSFTKS